MCRRVFVCVSGGVVDEVIVAPQTDGTWTVIDWDNIESDPEREWSQFDEEDRAYIKTSYVDEFARFYSQFDRREDTDDDKHLD
jgi:hypothetical protein